MPHSNITPLHRPNLRYFWAHHLCDVLCGGLLGVLVVICVSGVAFLAGGEGVFWLFFVQLSAALFCFLGFLLVGGANHALGKGKKSSECHVGGRVGFYFCLNSFEGRDPFHVVCWGLLPLVSAFCGSAYLFSWQTVGVQATRPLGLLFLCGGMQRKAPTLIFQDPKKQTFGCFSFFNQEQNQEGPCFCGPLDDQGNVSTRLQNAPRKAILFVSQNQKFLGELFGAWQLSTLGVYSTFVVKGGGSPKVGLFALVTGLCQTKIRESECPKTTLNMNSDWKLEDLSSGNLQLAEPPRPRQRGSSFFDWEHGSHAPFGFSFHPSRQLNGNVGECLNEIHANRRQLECMNLYECWENPRNCHRELAIRIPMEP